MKIPDKKVYLSHGRFKKILDYELDDPLSGLANLFDLGMVFAVALMLALVTYYNIPELLKEDSEVIVIKNPGKPNMELIKKKGIKLEKYRISNKTLAGEGQRLGVTYKLKNGEIIYVPDSNMSNE